MKYEKGIENFRTGKQNFTDLVRKAFMEKFAINYDLKNESMLQI